MLQVYLKPEFLALFYRLHELGAVRATHLSTSSNHQVIGRFSNLRNRSHLIMQFNPDIDVRLFSAKWRAVKLEKPNKSTAVLRFIDRFGESCYLVELLEKDAITRLDQWMPEWIADQGYTPQFKTKKAPAKLRRKLDQALLRKDWLAMTNVHQASRLIKRYANDSQAVYRYLGVDLARRLSPQWLAEFFELLITETYTLMLFARNDSAVQCYTGCLKEMDRTEKGLCFQGVDFEGFIDDCQIDALWLVRKPTSLGWVYSLNLFDNLGQEAWIFTDNRLRSQPENTDWLRLIQQAFDIN